MNMKNDFFRKKAIRKMAAVSMLSAMLGLLLSGCGGSSKIEELREQAIASYNAGDFASAEAQLDEALSSEWGKVSDIQIDILRYRAECELMQGKFNEALDTYEALLAADVSEEASKSYENVIAELSNLDKLSAMVSDIEAGEYQKAYDEASLLADLEGSAIGRLSWFNKAVCAEHLGNYEEAYELFNEYLKVYPEDAEAKKELDFLRTR